MRNLNQRILLERTLLHSIKNGILLYDERELTKQLHKIINKANKNIKKGMTNAMIKIKEVNQKNGLYEYKLEDGSTITVTQHGHDKLFYNTADGVDELELTFDGFTSDFKDASFYPMFSEVEYNSDPVECIGFIRI